MGLGLEGEKKGVLACIGCLLAMRWVGEIEPKMKPREGKYLNCLSHRILPSMPFLKETSSRILPRRGRNCFRRSGLSIL